MAAWEKLVSRYKRLVYSIAIGAGLDEDEADDAFQRVFLTLVEKLDQIEQPARISAWLLTTARREIHHQRRRERRVGVTTEGGVAQDDLIDKAPLPDDLLLHLEEQRQIHTALMSLDERCRTLLILLFYRPDPPPYAEIAALLGMTESGVGPTRARCLRKLRRLLEE